MRAPEVRLSREMGLLDITMIGVGAMIGAGIFVLTGIAAGIAGPALLLVFLLNGLVTLFAAAAYAELGSSFHDAGGGYLWVKTGLRDPHGFMSGWMSWFAHAVACALYALGFGAYFEVVLPLVGIHAPVLPFISFEKWLAVLVVGLFAYVNYRGASETGKAGNLITLGKIMVLGVFIAFGVMITLRRPDWHVAFAGFLDRGMGSVFTAMGLTFIAFEGYEIIAQCSEEVRDPKRNVPRAVFLSLLIVVPIYLLVAFAALGALRPENGMPSWEFLGLKKETALVDVAAGFFPGGGVMILIGGLLSTMSALNATIYSSSRVSYAMGRDRNLPAAFSRVHSLRRTPHIAIAVSAVLIAVMAVALPIEAVASAADIMFLLLFIQVLWVLIELRRKRPDLDRGFRVPWVPLVPILGIGLQLFLAAYLFIYSPRAWLSAAAWIAVGLGVFYLYARKRDRAYAHVVAVREAVERQEYRILVCFANPATAGVVLGAAGAVARANDGEVVALHVVEVADGEVLSKGMPAAHEAAQRLEHELRAHVDEVPARVVVKVAHRTSHAIIETAIEEKCNLIVMGRSRRPTMIERLAASIVDRVVRSAPARVMIVSADAWPSAVRTVLLPLKPGPNSEFTSQMASSFASENGARLRAVRVVPVSADAAEYARTRTEMRAMLQADGTNAEVRMVRGDDVAEAILEYASDADVVFTGGSDAGVLEHLFAYPVPVEVADRARGAVAMCYEMASEPKSWFD